ncbi:DUF998 domain-containing protein [Pseudozobellia sp. WGM2]|uniref:DUF998 domain-containing protein n=1 Tax=Pseudozobellia sp. WGM2 TaxID=2787625 RepID=UPI001ADFFA15|nr:DUF998 domain-containing protein [Pseudozobellia sp. WGM2]
MKTLTIFANATITFGLISILCLIIVHISNPNIRPSYRMVSEYALGKNKWLLTLFFLCWGLCSISSGLLLWDIVTSIWAKLGVVLLFISGLGAVMGGIFNIQHKLHGLSFAIGVPFLPIAALLISYHLIGKPEWQNYGSSLLFSTHAVWISLILMAITMFLFFSTLKSAGIQYGPDSPPLKVLPEGVIGLNGWANRLLVLAYIAYPIVTTKIFLTIINFKN